MSKTRIAVVCVLFLLMSLCSCGEKPVEVPDISMPPSSSALEEAPDISMPPSSSAPEEVPVSAPSDPMDDIYPVTAQEDAAKILKQAYEGMIPELTFAFSDTELSLQDRSIFLQNASNQVLSQYPELKYAYQLACEDGPDGTICKIQYMPYKLGYPNGIPEEGIEVRCLADLVEVADAHLGEEEIPITILDPDLLVDDMQRVLQQAGYGYVLYTLKNDATAICAFPGNSDTLEQSVAQAQELKNLAHSIAEQIFTDNMGDEEKLRAIYRCIVENTSYDYRYYQDPHTLPYESRTAYGPLKNGTAICGGFSWAFNMLCREAGIPCWNVTGVGAGEDHMWNCAFMNGEYRYFDTTWDAGITYEEQWRYFACTEEEITQNHQWGQGQEEMIHALTKF